MSALKLLPLGSVTSQIFHIPRHGAFPNSEPSSLPAVLYRPFDTDTNTLDPSAIEKLIKQNGFEPQWHYGMFPYDHFHWTTHELLVPFRGRATIILGGMREISVSAGDVLLLPAGVAHRAASTHETEFCMVGSYPVGSDHWDNCRGGENGADDRIKNLGLGGVNADPVFGTKEGAPVMKA